MLQILSCCKSLGGDEKRKMKKKFAIVVVAIMVMSAVLVMPVVSDDGGMNHTEERAINEAITIIASQKCIRSIIESGLPSVEELSSALGYSTSEQIKATQVSPTKNTFTSCIYSDINGDSINDVLVHVTTTDPVTSMISTDIIALDGSDGTRLWNKGFENCVAVALPVGDLNHDNKNDVIIDLIMCFPPYPERSYGAVIAVNGCNGTELWSEYERGEMPEIVILAGIPANLTSANRTDVLVSTMKINLLSGTATSEITAKNGSTGRELWTKSFTDDIAVGLPADLTNDRKDEVVIIRMRIGRVTTASDVIAIKGTNGAELWSKHYLDEVIAEPAGDLTGDGANDLTVQIGCCEIEALRGYDGEKLWTMEV